MPSILKLPLDPDCTITPQELAEVRRLYGEHLTDRQCQARWKLGKPLNLAQEAQQVTRNVPAELIYAPTDQAAQINDEVPVTRGTVRHADADQFYSFGDRAKMGLDAERTVGVTTFPRGETGPLPDNGR